MDFASATLVVMPRTTAPITPGTSGTPGMPALVSGTPGEAFVNPTSRAYRKRVSWSRGFSEFARPAAAAAAAIDRAGDASPPSGASVDDSLPGSPGRPRMKLEEDSSLSLPSSMTVSAAPPGREKETETPPPIHPVPVARKHPTMKGYRTKNWYAWSFATPSSEPPTATASW